MAKDSNSKPQQQPTQKQANVREENFSKPNEMPVRERNIQGNAGDAKTIRTGPKNK